MAVWLEEVNESFTVVNRLDTFHGGKLRGIRQSPIRLDTQQVGRDQCHLAIAREIAIDLSCLHKELDLITDLFDRLGILSRTALQRRWTKPLRGG
jgi:hypothetical protein